jgi:preprotein translocase subunit SecE
MTEARGGSGVATTERVGARPATAAGSSGRGGGSRNPWRRLSLFYREIVAELRKVIWPTRHELVTYTSVVVVFVTVMVAIVSGLDYLFTKAVLTVFG